MSKVRTEPEDAVGVVIVTHNRRQLLEQCVAAVRAQTHQPAFVLVVDSGSTDGTADWLARQPELVVHAIENRGGAFAYYTGLREATARRPDWLLLLDDDCEPTPTYLAEALAWAQRLRAHDRQQAVFTGRVWEAGRQTYFYGTEGSRWRTAAVSEAEPYPSDALGFPFMLVHRSVVEDVGLPYTFWFIVNDDVEWTYRMRRAGYRLQILPVEAGVHHAQHEKHRVLGRELTRYAPWKTYYVLRNSIILDRLQGASRWTAAVRHIPRVAAKGLHVDHRKERLRLAARGWWDGLRFDLREVA